VVAQNEDKAPTTIRFKYLYEESARMEYAVRLLQAACRSSEQEFDPYRIETAEKSLSRRREVLEVLEGDNLNIMWTAPPNTFPEYYDIIGRRLFGANQGAIKFPTAIARQKWWWCRFYGLP